MADDAVWEDSAEYRIRTYYRQRRKFSIITYCVAFSFVLLTILQWIPMVLVGEVEVFYQDHFYVSLIFLLFSLLGVSVFIFFERLRFCFPINWILAVLIIEGVTLGLAFAVATSNVLFFSSVALVTLVVIAAFIIIGIFIPHDFTLDVIIIFLVSVIFFFGLVVFVMIYILSELPVADYIFASLVLSIICIFMMYHAQTIHGGRYAEMRTKDYVLAALIVYHDYVIVYIVIYYLAAKQWVSTDDQFY